MDVDCPRCKAKNPDGKRFCGDCGGPLDPTLFAVNQFIDTSLRNEVQSILRENYKDQKLVEVETTQAIAARFTEWSKLLGFFVGIPVALLLFVLAVLGIKTYSDFTAQVSKANDEIKAQLTAAQASATKLKADGDSLARDYEKLRARFSDTSAIAAQLDTLSQKVDRIGEKLGFTPSSNVSSAIRSQIETSFRQYQQYLQNLGYRGISRQVEIDIRDKLEVGAIAYYDPEKQRMVIGRDYASDPTVLYREYMHHVLYSTRPPQGSESDLWAYTAIESGLASYFPSSFVGDPAQKHSNWSLTTTRSFSEIRPNVGSAMMDGTEIWGSAFWEMRQNLGQAASDKLLFEAWFKLRPADVAKDRGASFVKLLLTADPAHASQISDIFKRRGLTL